MKNKIIIITGIIVIFVLGRFAAQSWHSERVQAQVSQNKAAAAHSYQEWKRKQALEAEKIHVKAECIKSKSYYDKLSVKDKAAVAAPNCDIQIVE